MQRLKYFRIFFSLTALLFVAKPFIGFGAFNMLVRPCISHTILVKSFTKRKPESLQDADEKAETIHHQLSNPLMVLWSAIMIILAVVLPLLIVQVHRLTKKIVADMRTALLPPEQVYLLSGKLII